MNISEKTFASLVNSPERGTNNVSKKKMERGLDVKEVDIEGFKMITVQSHSATNKHIIFLHGGAYVAEAMKGHKFIIEELACKYSFKVSFIDYPLAPEHSAQTTLQIVKKAYKQVASDNGQDTLYLFGDSAGGGLALALLQTLRDKGKERMPQKTVLFSPWLDISMCNPEIDKYVPVDVLLSKDGLKKCGELYAKEIAHNDPIVSPLYGNLENLSAIKIFVSDCELFYPDCCLLKDKLDKVNGSSCELHIKSSMIHDWIMIPIRERDEAIKETAEFFMN